MSIISFHGVILNHQDQEQSQSINVEKSKGRYHDNGVVIVSLLNQE